MNTRQTTLLLLFLSCSAIMLSQNFDFGIFGNIGISRIDSQNKFGTTGHSDIAPSGGVGVFVERRINNQSKLSLHFGWTQIASKNKADISIVRTCNTFNHTVRSSRISNYLSLPLSYIAQYKQIGVRFGVHPMIGLFAKRKFDTVVITVDENSKPIDSKVVKNSEDFELKFMNFGMIFGTEYSLGAKAKITLNYHHGLTNFSKENSQNEVFKNRQVTLGLKYFIKKWSDDKLIDFQLG